MLTHLTHTHTHNLSLSHSINLLLSLSSSTAIVPTITFLQIPLFHTAVRIGLFTNDCYKLSIWVLLIHHGSWWTSRLISPKRLLIANIVLYVHIYIYILRICWFLSLRVRIPDILLKNPAHMISSYTFPFCFIVRHYSVRFMCFSWSATPRMTEVTCWKARNTSRRFHFCGKSSSNTSISK